MQLQVHRIIITAQRSHHIKKSTSAKVAPGTIGSGMIICTMSMVDGANMTVITMQLQVHRIIMTAQRSHHIKKSTSAKVAAPGTIGIGIIGITMSMVDGANMKVHTMQLQVHRIIMTAQRSHQNKEGLSAKVNLDTNGLAMNLVDGANTLVPIRPIPQAPKTAKEKYVVEKEPSSRMINVFLHTKV